jgi:hypothetical protein
MRDATRLRLGRLIRHCVTVWILCALAWPGAAAKLFHNDGTVVEGRIISETPDDVRVETRFGVLTYQKTDLIRIERDVDPASRLTPTPRPLDYSSLVTTGPVNPDNPPVVAPFALLASQGITAEMYRGGARPVPLRLTTTTTADTTAPAAATPEATPVPTPVAPPEPGPHNIGL